MMTIEFPDKFVALFRSDLGLTVEEYALFTSHFHKEFVGKKQHYLREGDFNTLKAYVTKGCSRNYIIDETGKEKTLFFCFEDWWLGDIESFLTGKPCKQYVQAIEDMELLCITKADFYKLGERIPRLMSWFNTKIQKTHFATMHRLMEAKCSQPEEQYLSLLEKQPDIYQRVPLQYIASYMNIEPQSLSRLRKRLTQK
ncbi:MAG: Crp/Fnr family transcriptional regulator [Bacteroidetes bacterium]|nr:Crp/Fnr family transcriptional regulator [Bacteroidota bacterium]